MCRSNPWLVRCSNCSARTATASASTSSVRPRLSNWPASWPIRPNFYHVLHFDGHGTFPQGGHSAQFYAQPGVQGRLLFEGEDGRPREVTGEELGGLLAGKGVPVVLLNACQSGMTHPESLYPSVGNQLLKAGVRGVVAMAYSVYVQTAVHFMARLYQGLMHGEELARAVALAREALRVHPQRFSPVGEIPLRDWVVPVLFEAAPVRVTTKPTRTLRLNPELLHDQQATAGTEIDCPEPPAFGFVGRDGVILELERAFQRRPSSCSTAWPASARPKPPSGSPAGGRRPGRWTVRSSSSALSTTCRWPRSATVWARRSMRSFASSCRWTGTCSTRSNAVGWP